LLDLYLEQDMPTIRGTYPTSAGMHCLWDELAFSKVNGYDSWARELENDKDITRHIQAGHFVPLNIRSDGAMEIEVRLGAAATPSTLTERESQYVIVKSEPYLMRSSGHVHMSGIEHVAFPPRADVGTIALPAGAYAVTVHLMAWDEEPGMRTPEGNPAPGALPDFLVFVNPARGDESFRQSIETFPKPA
jgi:hypothetical protein